MCASPVFVYSVVRVLKDPRSSFDYRTAVGESQPLEFSQVSGSVAQRAGRPWNTRLGEITSEWKGKIRLCARMTEKDCSKNIENHCDKKVLYLAERTKNCYVNSCGRFASASVAPADETHPRFDKTSCLHTQMRQEGSVPGMQ